ncbi:hypothetical protein D7231_31715, partial [Streptomyces klenkii]
MPDHHVTALKSRQAPGAEGAPAEAAQRGGPRWRYDQLTAGQAAGLACCRCGEPIPARWDASRPAGATIHPQYGYEYRLVACNPTCHLPKRTPAGHWPGTLPRSGHA